MTSILTNVAANTALLNLENTNANLQNIQNQISTGLQVSSAADNASYFSIATVLRSDSSALSTVSDSLNLGGSSLNVATSALGQVSTTLSDIKNQLLAAANPNVDRSQIQEQISQDQAQLKSIANSANFNGQNFLSVNSSAANYNPTQEFISSFSRDSSGAISVGTIALNLSGTALFDSGGTYSPTNAGAITTTLTSSTASATPPAGITTPNAFTATAGNGALQITSYTQNQNPGTQWFANTITINNVSTADGAPVVTETPGTTQNTFGGLTSAQIGSGDTVGGIATGSVAGTGPSYDSTAHTLTFSVLENDSTTAGDYSYNQYVVNNFNPSVGAGILDQVDTSTTGSFTDSSGNVTSSTAYDAANNITSGTGVSIFNMNISSLTGSSQDQAYLNALQQQVDAAISSVTASASAIGTAQSRMTNQSTFISSLQTSLNDGIGSLVDADLNVASTRLQALQVQQQLGVQSLSIANQSTQAVLKLFQ